MQPTHPIAIGELYPDMNDAELSIAESNLKRYAALILRVHERLKAEGKTWPEPPPA